MPIDSNTLEVVRALFPGEAIKELTTISVGWNSNVYILNEKFAIKIPKTKSATKGIEKELALTEAIRHYIPAELPTPISRVIVDGIYGFSYKLIKGKMMTTRPLPGSGNNFDPTKIIDSNLYMSIQKQLAEILSSIHRIDPQVVQGILIQFEDENWAGTYARLGKKWGAILRKTFAGNELIKAKILLEETIDGIAACHFQQKFIHGDFGGWNIIYDEKRKGITGILDWADSCIGDPAVDFSELIYDYGEQYAAEVLAFYDKESDSSLMDRAKLYLRLEGFRDLHYGVVSDSSEFVEKGRKNIEKMIRQTGN